MVKFKDTPSYRN